MPEEDPRARENGESPRPVMLGLIITLLLVLGCLFLFYKLRDMSQRADCMMQGRSNCAPVEATTPAN